MWWIVKYKSSTGCGEVVVEAKDAYSAHAKAQPFNGRIVKVTMAPDFKPVESITPESEDNTIDAMHQTPPAIESREPVLFKKRGRRRQ